MKSVIIAFMTWGCKMRRSELIARLNTLRFEIETSGIKTNNYNLETIETCLYYFIDEEDADPHWA